MFLIRSSCVPGSRSFGPLPGPSSEGFLDTFTPGKGSIVIFCDYSFSSEDCSEDGFIHILQVTAEKLQSGRVNFQEHAYQSEEREVPTSQSFSIVGVPEETQVPRGSSSTELNLRRIQSKEPSFGRRMRHNLMMTAPRGILVAENPTEDGRIGTGRNTHEKSS